MNEAGLIASNGTIRFARLIHGPAEHLWKYLTSPHLRSNWLAKGTLEPRLGGFLELSFDVAGGAEQLTELPITGVVTRCCPPESLGFTWTDASTISHVAFELETRGTAVLFLVTHAGLPMNRIVPFAASWHVRLDMLETILRGREPASYADHFRWALHHYEHHREARALRARAESELFHR